MFNMHPLFQEYRTHQFASEAQDARQAEDVGSIPITCSKLWGRAAVARQAHNLEVGGSNPSPATIAPELDITPVKIVMLHRSQ